MRQEPGKRSETHRDIERGVSKKLNSACGLSRYNNNIQCLPSDPSTSLQANGSRE